MVDLFPALYQQSLLEFWKPGEDKGKQKRTSEKAVTTNNFCHVYHVSAKFLTTIIDFTGGSNLNVSDRLSTCDANAVVLRVSKI